MAECTTVPQSRPAPHRSESTKGPFWKLAAIVGGFTLVAVSVWFGLRGENIRVAASAHGFLSLTATQHNDDIQLRWDPQSEDIRRSKQVLLSILDGDLQTITRLRSEDLLNGRITYIGVSNVVRFRLKVLAPDGEWREGEQLIVRLRPESAEAPRSMRADGQTSPSGVPQETQTPGATPIVMPIARPNLNEVANVAAETQIGQFANRSFDLPEQPETPMPFLEKPPEAMWTAPITSAVLVRQVKAIVPPDLQRMINREVTLHVRLSIDESGNVIDSLQLGTKEFLVDSLFRIAAEAARQWKYQPARLGTQAVATILDVEFRFAPVQ